MIWGKHVVNDVNQSVFARSKIRSGAILFWRVGALNAWGSDKILFRILYRCLSARSTTHNGLRILFDVITLIPEQLAASDRAITQYIHHITHARS
jgi:hypothetical protein